MQKENITTNVVNGNIRLESGRLKLPKTDPVKIIVHRPVPMDGRLKSVTVVREPSGKYYASLLYEQAASENQTGVPVRPEKVLGMDFAMYRNMEIPSEQIGQRRLLRSLFSV